MYADVVTLFFAAADIVKAAKAAKFVGGVKAILAKFKPKTIEASKGIKGIMLEATEGSNTVQIFRDVGDGKPMGLYTQRDVDALQESITDEGLSEILRGATCGSRCQLTWCIYTAFSNCQNCVAPPSKRDAPLYPRGLAQKVLCCFVTPKALEAPETHFEAGSSSSVPGVAQAPGTIGKLLNPAGLADDAGLLPRMIEGFKEWFSGSGKVPLAADAETTKWVTRIAEGTTDDALWQVRTDYIKEHQLEATEVNAIGSWISDNWINRKALESGLPRIPPTTGLVTRAVDLPVDVAKLLIDGAPGPISQGERGIYEVRGITQAHLNVW